MQNTMVIAGRSGPLTGPRFSRELLTSRSGRPRLMLADRSACRAPEASPPQQQQTHEGRGSISQLTWLLSCVVCGIGVPLLLNLIQAGNRHAARHGSSPGPALPWVTGRVSAHTANHVELPTSTKHWQYQACQVPGSWHMYILLPALVHVFTPPRASPGASK